MGQSRFALAIHALVLLARTPEWTTSGALAASVNVHATCVRRLLSAFVRAGLVEASEGRDGGYRLARPAAEISLAEIYRVAAGEPLFHPALAAVNPRCPVSVALGPAIADIAAEAETRLQDALARRTLADVTDRIALRIAWVQ